MKLLDELREQGSQLRLAALQSGLRHVRVVGSVARCEERPDSDVDLIARFAEGWESLAYAQEVGVFEFHQYVAELTGRDVDLVVVEFLPAKERADALARWDHGEPI